MNDIYKDLAKVLTKDAAYEYRGYSINKRGNSISAIATSDLLEKASGKKIKKSIIGYKGTTLSDMKDMIDRELLASGLNDVKDADPKDSKGNILKDEKGTKVAKYEKQGNVFIVKDIYGNVYEIGKSDIKWLEEKESQGKLRWGDIKSVGSLRRDLM